MKKGKAACAAALAVLILSGCASRTETVSSRTEAASSKAASSAPVSSAGEDAWMDGTEAVALTGENSDFQLGGLTFSDAETGWIIGTRYASDGTARSRLFATQDGGGSWAPVGADNLPLEAVRFVSRTEGWAVAADAADSASADGTEQVKYRLLHTADGGKIWETQWQGGAVPEAASDLYFSDARNGYALAGSALLRTKDGGKTWTAVKFSVPDFRPVKIFFSGASDGWAAGTDEKKETLFVLHTSNGGKSWENRFQKKYDEGAAGCAGMDFLNEKEGWFLTSDLSTWNSELYHTLDGGASWKSVGALKSVRPTPEGIDFTDSQTGWIPLDVGAGPVAGGIAVTRDGGKSFSVLGDTEQGIPENTRKVTSAKQVLFLSERNGWVIGSDPSRGDFLLYTDDGGQNWQQKYPAPQPTVDLSLVNDTTGFGLGMLGDPNALLRTTDGGKTWRQVFSFAGSYQAEQISFVSAEEGWALASSVNTDQAGGQTILHTSDGGVTWEKPATAAGNPPDFSDADDQPFRMPASAAGWTCRAMAALSGGKKGMILAENADQPGKMELLTTRNGGKTWNAHPFPEESGGAVEFLQDSAPMRFTDDRNGWLLTAHGLLRTEDGGRSWSWLS